MNKKEIMMIFLVSFIVFISVSWSVITQPTFTKNSISDKTQYISAKNLKHQVYTIVEKFPNRVYTNTFILNKTAEYLHDEFSKYSDAVSYSLFKVDGRIFKNVIANFKGEKSCKEGIYIIGAHYDTCNGNPGANDNSSGLAALIELARVFKEHKPKCDLQIVSYPLEEPPYFRTNKMGSFFHAKRLKEKNQKVKLAIVFDMIGFYNNKENSQNYPIPLMKCCYPSKANFIAVIGNLSPINIKYTREAKNALKKTSNLPVYSINAPSFIPGIDFSDHQNYWYFDFPSIFITDTAFYRNDNYHTNSDLPQTLNYENMAKAVEGIFNLVKH